MGGRRGEASGCTREGTTGTNRTLIGCLEVLIGYLTAMGHTYEEGGDGEEERM
jgi:hypothetical protein